MSYEDRLLVADIMKEMGYTEIAKHCLSSSPTMFNELKKLAVVEVEKTKNLVANERLYFGGLIYG